MEQCKRHNGKFSNLRTVTARVHVGNPTIFINQSGESSVIRLAMYESKGQEHLRRTLLAFPSSQKVQIWRLWKVTRPMATNTIVYWTNLLAALAVRDVASISAVPEWMSAAPHIKLHTTIGTQLAR